MDSSLKKLFTCLSFPSVSTDSNYTEDVRDCANWLLSYTKEMGLESTLHETSRHPIIVAKSETKPNRPNILLYGHYDVQPVDPIELWSSQPFEPEIQNDRIYARGASDNKGQFMAHLCGIEQTLSTHGELPVNLTIILEGEEEIGSPNLKPFLQEHTEQLKSDIIVISDNTMMTKNLGTLAYGTRGLTALEITLQGPSNDLHSGIWGGSVANPANALSQLISTLHDDDKKVTIEGFYDDVLEIQDWEKEQWEKLPGDDQETKDITGATELTGEKNYTSFEQRVARPTADVNGIWGGYQGEGSKTIVPAKASAKLSFRLVPNQDPEDINKKIHQHLEKHLPKGVSIDISFGHSGESYMMDPHSKFGVAAQNALRKTFQGDPLLIREGGTLPILSDFKTTLGAESLLLGLALPDANMHGPDENLPVKNFEQGIELNKNLLQALAES